MTALAVASVANDVVVVERLERVRRVPSLKTTKISKKVKVRSVDSRLLLVVAPGPMWTGVLDSNR